MRPALIQTRAVLALAAVLTLATALYAFQVLDELPRGWWLLALGMVLGALGQIGVEYPAPPPAPPPLPPTRWRFWIGGLLAVAGIALWAASVLTLMRGWVEGFDRLGGLAHGDRPVGDRPRSRLGHLAAAGGAALDAAGRCRSRWRCSRWRRSTGSATSTTSPARPRSRRSRICRSATSAGRTCTATALRWEYLSSTWLAALGIWLGGPSQFADARAVRGGERAQGAAAVRLAAPERRHRRRAGRHGAAGGARSGTSSCRAFPTTTTRSIVATVFALLAGPVRRGRPSAYVLLGFLRRLRAARVRRLSAAGGLRWSPARAWSLRDRAAGWTARVARPLLTARAAG